MTQRIFDVENEKDMADLWDILPECIVKIKKENNTYNTYSSEHIGDFYETGMLKIDFHNKREIIRPIQEATEADVGKICRFWDDESEEFFGRLGCIGDKYFTMIAPVYEDLQFLHCRRLTKKEISELC